VCRIDLSATRKLFAPSRRPELDSAYRPLAQFPKLDVVADRRECHGPDVRYGFFLQSIHAVNAKRQRRQLHKRHVVDVVNTDEYSASLLRRACFTHWQAMDTGRGI